MTFMFWKPNLYLNTFSLEPIFIPLKLKKLPSFSFFITECCLVSNNNMTGQQTFYLAMQ